MAVFKAVAHKGHTHKEYTEARGNLSVIAVIVLLYENNNSDADKGKYRNDIFDVNGKQERCRRRTDF